MPHFDLHMHPVFKQAIRRFETVYPSERPAEELVRNFDLDHDFAEWVDENFLHILESQCCMEQLDSRKPVFGVAAIAPIERFFTHRSGLFGKLLNGSFTDPFDKDYMDTIRAGGISYYQLFLKELGLYRKLAGANKISWISRADGKKALKHSDGVNLLLGMEGGHALSRALIGRPGQADTPATLKGPADEAWKDFVGLGDPSKELELVDPAAGLQRLQQALWKDGLDLFYLTLTHLSHIGEQFLATHAYGMKMIETREAYPQGSGLSELGKDVVKAAYGLKVKVGPKGKETEQDASVLIDIKHMGLKARRDLYELRRQLGITKPLLATHMGVTGYSIAEWVDALIPESAHVKDDPRCVGFTMKRQQTGEWGLINRKFSFNAWSINLMDEDIIEVFKSGGLIGVSLDVRILGWQNAFGKDDVEEFLSVDDFRHFFPREYAHLFRKPTGVERLAATEDWFKPTKEERHPLALCFNLLHVISVGKVARVKDPNGKEVDPWKHVCIGSDFDGLIDPLKNARDASRFDDLGTALRRWLPEAHKAYRKQHGGPELFTEAALDGLVDDVLGKNGIAFLKDRW